MHPDRAITMNRPPTLCPTTEGPKYFDPSSAQVTLHFKATSVARSISISQRSIPAAHTKCDRHTAFCTQLIWSKPPCPQRMVAPLVAQRRVLKPRAPGPCRPVIKSSPTEWGRPSFSAKER